jgi:hypothetical protein
MIFIIVGTLLCLISIGMMSNLKTAALGGILLIIGLFCIKKGREKSGWRKID